MEKYLKITKVCDDLDEILLFWYIHTHHCCLKLQSISVDICYEIRDCTLVWRLVDCLLVSFWAFIYCFCMCFFTFSSQIWHLDKFWSSCEFVYSYRAQPFGTRSVK